ncbi:Pol polyprotein [Vitis vinifera]|uniref:Pol polyprotein n=1 Tax=Vitis vinifera TaxID=29760 RepID=A0A438FV83_VITVI|nr:Pol polyprotein [Vitis vinifera]
MSSSMKQILETMCGGDFMSKNPEEAMDFLSYVLEVSRGWDEPNNKEMGKRPVQQMSREGMYNLSEDMEMKAKVAAMARKIEKMELRKVHEVQAISEPQQQANPCSIYQSFEHMVEECPTIPAAREMFREQANLIGQWKPNSNAPYGNTYNSSWRNHPNFAWKPRPNPYQSPTQSSQQSQGQSSVEQALISLSKVMVTFASAGDKADRKEEKKKEQKGKEVQMKESIIPSMDEEPQILLKEGMMKKHMPPPFPQALRGKKPIKNASEILDVLRQVKRTQCYKASLPNRASECYNPMQVSNQIQRSGVSTISVNIGGTQVEKALLDLGASVNLLPYSVYKELGLGELKPTSITLSLADRSVKIPRGVIEDVLVQVDKFYYPVDFVVLDTDPIVKGINYVPIILGRPFLATSNAIINCRNGVMQLTFGNMTLELNIFHLCQKHIHPEEDEGLEEFEENPDESHEDLDDGLAEPMGMNVVMSNWRQKPVILPLFKDEEEMKEAKDAILKLELKTLPAELKYAYLEEGNKAPVVISSSLTVSQEDNLLRSLESTRRPSDGKISDLKGISPLICTHHIYMEEADAFGYAMLLLLPRCMLSIFSDMVERIMEVFMDDITMYGTSFEDCLSHLEDVLKRCIEKDLVLNWEKCHFMVNQAPIVRAPNWELPFEVMCDSSDYAIGLFWDKEKMLNLISFSLKYLLTKQNAKARLIRWVLLLQEFNLQIRDKKGVENVVADHLSRLNIAHDTHGLPINDDFPEESLMLVEEVSWFAHIANYLVTGEIPSEWSSQDKKNFFAKVHAYYWEEPFLFKYCADQIIRKCVPEQEKHGILSHCMGMHVEATCHSKTAMRVLQSGFWWPSLFKDAHEVSKGCDKLHGTFPMSFSHSYILVGVDYVSKWVEAIPCRTNDHKVVLKFLKKTCFSRFGVPKAIISDGGTHFCNKPFEALLAKYGVKDKVATPYHPQTSGQVELANREIKNILMKVVNINRKDWSVKLLDSLWAYRTAYKTILGCHRTVLFMQSLPSSR